MVVASIREQPAVLAKFNYADNRANVVKGGTGLIKSFIGAAIALAETAMVPQPHRHR
jgi:hypothetical protein